MRAVKKYKNMIQIRNINKPKVFLLDGDLKFAKDTPPMLSEIFHENSKLYPYDVRPWLHQRKPPGLEHTKLKAFMERSAKSYKVYPTLSQTPLPTEDPLERSVNLWEVMHKRRSRRDYSEKPLQLSEVSRILFYGYGETSEIDLGNYSVSLRASPSAGALYPLDIYPLICRVDEIDAGLYHYNVRDHTLEQLKKGEFLNDLIPLIQSDNNEWLAKAAIVFFITTTFRRNQMKYGERGYRGVLLDAGHLSQNILLAATGLGLGSCIIMACMDDQVNNFLGVDGVEESVLYSISIGHTT